MLSFKIDYVSVAMPSLFVILLLSSWVTSLGAWPAEPAGQSIVDAPGPHWRLAQTDLPTQGWKARITLTPNGGWFGSGRGDRLADDLLWIHDGERWAPVDDAPLTSRAFVLDADDRGGLWLVAFDPTLESTYGGLWIHRFASRRWQSRLIKPGIWPQAIEMLSPDEGWIAGNNGAFLRLQQGQWSHASLEMPAPDLEGRNILDLDLVDSDSGWAVGIGGLVARFADGRWTPVEAPPQVRTQDLNAIAATAEGFRAVGSGGLMVEYQRGQWQVEEPVSQPILGIALTSHDEGWAVGLAGMLLRLHQGHWQVWPSPTEADLYDVEMSGPTMGWVVGDGVLLRLGEDKASSLFAERAQPELFPPIRYPGRTVAAGDFDGDDSLDLVLQSRNQLRLFLGRGDFGMSEPVRLETQSPVGVQISGFALGDIDADQDLDLIVSHRASRSPLTLLRNQQGRFVSSPLSLATPESSVGGRPYLVDLDGDGHLDLFAAYPRVPAGKTVGMSVQAHNDGQGVFEPFGVPVVSRGADKGVLWGDLDGDDDLDALITGYDASEMAFYRNDGAGNLLEATSRARLNRDIPPGLYWESHLLDLDQDLDLDILLFGQQLVCFENDGHARFSIFAGCPAGLSSTLGVGSTLSAVGDLDLDGFLDLLLMVFAQGQPSLRLLLRDATGAFVDQTSRSGLQGVDGTGAVLADFDDDGDLDLFVASEGGSRLFENRTSPRPFLKVQTRSERGNHHAVGARVAVFEAGHVGDPAHLRGIRVVGLDANPTSHGNLEQVHFGLAESVPHDVEVRFPGGRSVIRPALSPGTTKIVHAESVSHRRILRWRGVVARSPGLPRAAATLLAGGLLLALAFGVPWPRLGGRPALEQRELGFLLGGALVAITVLSYPLASWWEVATGCATFVAAMVLAWLLERRLQRRLGPYRFLSKLGEGGSGKVYLARDERNGKKVALKIPRFEGGADASGGSLQSEAERLCGLEHPNLVRGLDFGRTDGKDFLVMEWLRGETLRQRLNRDPGLEVAVIRELARAIAGALGLLHSRGLLHRDVKAENIFLVKEVNGAVRIKLMDLGLAEPLRAASLTRPHQLQGTLSHLPPEILGGAPMGPETDFWALGVVLYETLTGHHPAASAADGALSLGQLIDPPPLPATALAEDAGLDSLLRRLLDRDPTCRPATSAEVLALLRGRPRIESASGLPADQNASAATPARWRQRLEEARLRQRQGRPVEAHAKVIECLELLHATAATLAAEPRQALLASPEVEAALQLADSLCSVSPVDGESP